MVLPRKEGIARTIVTLEESPRPEESNDSPRKDKHLRTERYSAVDKAFPHGQHKKHPVLHDRRVTLLAGQGVEKEVHFSGPIRSHNDELASNDSSKVALSDESVRTRSQRNDERQLTLPNRRKRRN